MTQIESNDPNRTLEAELIDAYGEVDIQVGAFPQPISLNKALEMEAAFCPAEIRKDPADRVSFILGKVAATGMLRQEHLALVPLKED